LPDKQPNIVFLLCDNVGWGDFSCYGGSTPTPRIDKLAGEGIRFNNYTVESQCTPSRSAILTGRQSVRSGTYTVPLPGTGPSGLAPWEYTIAELLSDAVYITFDLDAFDSSVISALGTPEPGGLHWDEVSDLLETVAHRRRIVGFDVTELAPSLGPRANAQVAAKLAYRLIGLAVRE